jgi:hypothetical protein
MTDCVFTSNNMKGKLFTIFLWHWTDGQLQWNHNVEHCDITQADSQETTVMQDLGSRCWPVTVTMITRIWGKATENYHTGWICLWNTVKSKMQWNQFGDIVSSDVLSGWNELTELTPCLNLRLLFNHWGVTAAISMIEGNWCAIGMNIRTCHYQKQQTITYKLATITYNYPANVLWFAWNSIWFHIIPCNCLHLYVRVCILDLHWFEQTFDHHICR